VRLPAGSNQLKIMQAMLDRGVATRRGVMCIHRETPYQDALPAWPLAQSEQAQDGCILLPLFPQMTAEMQLRTVEALGRALTS
jgi:dTDP-4-amino-4,6-dideoxygalactose transaminase